MFDWLKSDSSRSHFGFRARSPDTKPGLRSRSSASPQDTFEPLSYAEPPLVWVSLDRVVDVALRSRAEWLAQRGVTVHFSPGDVSIRSDAAGAHRIVEELIQWAAGRAPELAITASGAGPGSPNLLVRARLASPQPGGAAQTSGGHEGLLRQLRRLDVRTFFASEPQSLCFGVEFVGGTAQGAVLSARDSGQSRAASISLLAGRRLAVLAQNETLHHSIRNLTRGLGLSVRPFASVAQARQDAARNRPHAVIYDARLDETAIRSLRCELTGDNATSFLAVHEGAADFHLTQLAGLTTGHVGLGALEHALIPALVFTLSRN